MYPRYLITDVSSIMLLPYNHDDGPATKLSDSPTTTMMGLLGALIFRITERPNKKEYVPACLNIQHSIKR